MTALDVSFDSLFTKFESGRRKKLFIETEKGMKRSEMSKKFAVMDF